MRSRIFCWLSIAAVVLGCVAVTPRLSAQTRDDADTKKKKQERDERMREMTRRWLSSKAYRPQEGKDVDVARLRKPLFRFSDPARGVLDGTVWAWGSTGRPVALLTQEMYETKWAYELISLTSERISVATHVGWRWRPVKPGLQLKRFPQSTKPAASKSARLRQMKQLARRFTLVQPVETGRVELRLLPRPLHRYSYPATGLIDGALFIYVYGTNPEGVIAVECHRERSGDSNWHYGVAPLTGWYLTAWLDGKEVWKIDWVPSARTQNPYSNFGERVK